MIVGEYNKEGYRFFALFEDGTMTLFGKIGRLTYIDCKNEEMKIYWLRGNCKTWDMPKSANSLERYLLWNKPTIRGSIIDYKKIFGNI